MSLPTTPPNARAARRILVGTALALALVPGIARAQDTQPSLGARSSLSVDYTYTHFQDGTDPWQLASVSLGRRTAAGSIMGRVNVADRFATRGAQFEVDAYPRLGEKAYAYLNVGYAGSDVFPTWRFGGELYANLPNAWEASFGVRELRFDASDVTLYTGAIGKYAGNYWISLRPFVRPDAGDVSASVNLTVRRYYENADHYVGFRIGYGSTPTDRLNPGELQRTSAFAAAVRGTRPVGSGTFALWSLGYDREELEAGTIRNRIELSLGLRIDF